MGGKGGHGVLTPRGGDGPRKAFRRGSTPTPPGPTRGGDKEAGCLPEKVPGMPPADEAVGPHSLWTGILMSPALGAIPQPSDATYSGKSKRGGVSPKEDNILSQAV